MILRLGPVISKEFSLSPEQWGNIVALIMVALAVLDIPGSIWSDRYGSGWKRARFQVPLVLGYTALSFISGIKAISHGLTAFVLLRVGVNLGAGWGEPVGVSNTPRSGGRKRSAVLRWGCIIPAIRLARC